MNISDKQAEAFRTAAAALLAALPPSEVQARQDAQNAFDSPKTWVALLGWDAAIWAFEQALEATAEHTVNGWEDDAARAAFEALYAEFGL